MTLAQILIAAVLLGGQSPDDRWSAVWQDLARLKGMASDQPEAFALASELYAFVRDAEGEPRAALLEAQLDRWGGRDPAAIAVRLGKLPSRSFGAEESWLLAEVLPPGRGRVRAVLHALVSTDSLSQERLLFAWNVAVDEAGGLRLAEGALPIQMALHARYKAVWSAIDVSLTLTRLGEPAGADAVLAEIIAQEEAAQRPTAELWSQRGVNTLGSGDERRARSYLGRALAQGSENAALVLGLLGLQAGDLDEARNGFRTSILSDRPAAWALRGWGLTLLPDANAEPADASAPAEH